MARFAHGVTITATGPRGAGSVSDPINGATVATLTTAYVDAEALSEASLAVLEGDGASPTQQHVDDLRALYDDTVAAAAALIAVLAPAPQQTDIVLSVDAATVTTKNQLRAGLQAIMLAVEGGSPLT